MIQMKEIEQAVKCWKAPEIPVQIAHGDMPGDKVQIGDTHIQKANTIFPLLLEQVKPLLLERQNKKIVVSVCGGSGVGKSETASLLSFYFNSMGIGSYTLSGDNYPRRIPLYNDAERLRVFRVAALKAMIEAGAYTKEHAEMLREWQVCGADADPALCKEHPWMEAYIQGGREGLKAYLGTEREIDFQELSSITERFLAGDNNIWLKRMGRVQEDLWYEQVDFSDVQVLMIEWTHGNNENLKGVDAAILLNSTPQETLEHRKARNRDGAVDSPFTTMVLELEQQLLFRQAPRAKIIISKTGEVLPLESYLEIMRR